MKAKILLLCLALIIFTGCGGPNASENQKWNATANYFALLVEQATAAKNAGLLDFLEIAAIDAAVTHGNICLRQWRNSIDDPNLSSPHLAICVNAAMLQLLQNLPPKE